MLVSLVVAIMIAASLSFQVAAMKSSNLQAPKTISENTVSQTNNNCRVSSSERQEDEKDVRRVVRRALILTICDHKM